MITITFIGPIGLGTLSLHYHSIPRKVFNILLGFLFDPFWPRVTAGNWQLGPGAWTES